MNAILEQINSTGKIFVEFALPMLIQSSVLILILLLTDFALRKKVRAVFRYWIWLLVLLKLVLPTSLSSPMSLGYFFGDGLAYVDISRTATEAETMETTQANVSPIIETPRIEASRHTSAVAPIIPETEPAVTEPINPPVVSVTPITWQGAVFSAWLSVVMAMGLLLLQRAFFVRGLVAQAKEANDLITDTLESCRGSMGVKRKIGLKVSANATSPAVCGLFRPVILVPKNLTSSLSKSQLRAVLLHELAHIRRGDLSVNLAQTVLQIIYFYNLLLWLANCIIRRVREQAVDEMVLVAMGEKARQYPQTLVNVAKMAFKRPALSLRLIGVVESKSALAGRIKHILNRPMPKRVKLGILGLAIVIITAAILLPMATCTPGPPSLVIKGVVKDAQTGEPIAGARVFDDGYGPKPNWEQIKADVRSEWGAITNSAGEYSFLTWPEHHSIKVEAPGYKSERQSLYSGHFVFNKKDEEIFDFALEPEKASDSSEFKKTLPNGVTVELVGICEHPSEGKKWWKPDGTELSKEIRVRTRGRVSASGIPYTVAVKVTMPEDATFELGRIKGSTGGISLEAVDSEGRPISNMRAWMVYIDEKLTATSIQLGAADGPWKTRAKNRSKGSISTAGIVFSKAYESDEGVRIIVADEHLDLDYRITAIDTQGKEHLFQQRGGSAGKVRQTTALFHDIKLNQIEYFLFQTRPYEWVEFKNVSLRPGQKTNVRVEGARGENRLGRAKKDVIVSAKDKEQIAKLVEKLKSKDDAVWKPAAEQLKKIGPKVAQQVAELFRTVPGDLHAIRVLKSMATDEHVQAVMLDNLKLDRNRHLNTIHCSLIILAESGNREHVGKIIPLFQKDIETGRNYSMAEIALGQLGGDEAYNALIECLTKKIPDQLRFMIADHLVGMGRVEAIPHLKDTLKFVDPLHPSAGARIVEAIHRLEDKTSGRTDSPPAGMHSSEMREYDSGRSLNVYDLPSAMSTYVDKPPAGANAEETMLANFQALAAGSKGDLFFERLDGQTRFQAYHGTMLAPLEIKTESSNEDWTSAVEQIHQNELKQLVLEYNNRNGKVVAGRIPGFRIYPFNEGDLFAALLPSGQIAILTSKNMESSPRLSVYYLDPLLALVGTARIEASQDSAADADKSQFIATLPNGVTVELVGICEHPSEGKQWWQPDGTELSKEIRVRTRGRVSASGIPYTVAAKVTMPEDATFELGRIKGSTGGISLEAVDSEGRPISNMRAWMVYIDEKLTATSIQLGAADGPWKTRVRDCYKSRMGLARLVFPKAYESDGEVRIILADEPLGLDFRITAIDMMGKEHLFQQRGGSAGRARQTTTFFHDIKLNQIEYFLFQTRPYEWVEFKNVSLRPGVKTDVQVEGEKPQSLIFHGLDLTAVPHTTNSSKLPDLFEERPLGSKSYHIQKDVTAIYSGLDGTVYFIPRRNIFYVQHDKLGSSTLTYYGPFEGNPVQVLNLQPDVQVEGEEVEKTGNLVWGEEVNGLRAAVEFVPEKGSYSMGERIDIRFNIQNVSDKVIQISYTEPFGSIAEVTNSDGKEFFVIPPYISGGRRITRHNLKSGEIVLLRSFGLGFGREDDPALIKDIKETKEYFIAEFIQCEPGQYSIQYKLFLPNIKVISNVNEKDNVPQPDDWQGVLDTAVQKVIVTERPPADPRRFELVLDRQSMRQAVYQFAQKYRARVCFEGINYEAIPELRTEQYLLSGTFSAPTIPEMLDSLTQMGPFTWEKFNHTYVVYPRKESLLRFRINIDARNTPLESVVRKILDQSPDGREFDIKMAPDVHPNRCLRHVWITESSAMFALSHALKQTGQGIIWALTKHQGGRRLSLHHLPQAQGSNVRVDVEER